METRFKILPRFIDGVDQAPETARKTNKVYLVHEEYATGDGIPYVTGDEASADTLLTDPTVEAVADKLALAEELLAAALEDGV